MTKRHVPKYRTIRDFMDNPISDVGKDICLRLRQLENDMAIILRKLQDYVPNK